MQTAKTLVFAGAIASIVIGILVCFTLFLIPVGIVDIIGGIILLKYKDFTDEEFKAKGNTILTWGIILLILNLVGGICILIAYFLSVGENRVRKNSNIDELMELEKAFELMQKGVITEEEYEKIKEKIIRGDNNRQ